MEKVIGFPSEKGKNEAKKYDGKIRKK